MITNEYKKILQNLHSQKKFTEQNVWYDSIKKYVQTEALPNSILDFGCSHGSLISKLKNDFPGISIIDGYDPGVLEYENKPNRQYDLLISTDVIEHIEPEFLDETLSYMESLYEKNAWIIIACYLAKKFLPDGRNAHLTVQPPEWWLDKIKIVMPHSTIISQETITLNPNHAIKNKIHGGILVPMGQAVELRLVLKKK